MLVTCVRLRDFRTHEDSALELRDGITVVHGPNGVGKTNLLEGIYFACTARSIRASSDRDLIRFGSPAARAVAHTSDGENHFELAVGVAPGVDGPRLMKRMWLNGAQTDSAFGSQVRPLISVFLPDRLELIKGSPALRRSHVDELVFAVWPSRRPIRRAYSHALMQRNALLAGLRSGYGSRSTLSSWDMEVARHAVQVIEHRDEVLNLLADRFTRRCSELGLGESCAISYKPRTATTDPEVYVGELTAQLDRDIRRGYSTYGPQRDDFVITSDGRELRSFGSQGQQRTALLALLLAERDLLEARRGVQPLMLLDDVMSELDSTRRELLVRVLADSGQSIITTTDPDHVPNIGVDVALVRICANSRVETAVAVGDLGR